MSHLMEGIFNIFKKTAFWNFWPRQGVHLQDVHGLHKRNSYFTDRLIIGRLKKFGFHLSLHLQNPNQNSIILIRILHLLCEWIGNFVCWQNKQLWNTTRSLINTLIIAKSILAEHRVRTKKWTPSLTNLPHLWPSLQTNFEIFYRKRQKLRCFVSSGSTQWLSKC